MQRLESIVLECDRAVRTARCGDSRAGLRMAAEAYRRAGSGGEQREVLVTLNAVAICQSSNGAHINALGTAIDAYRLARSLGERVAANHAKLSIASASNDLFDMPAPEALAAIDHCIAEAMALGDVSLEARSHNVLGKALARGDRHCDARLAFERALALLPASDGTTPSALLLGNIAHLAVRWAQAAPANDRAPRIAEARRRIDAALAAAVADRAVGAELRAHFNRGRLLHVEGRDREALESYGRSLEIATRLKNRSRIADVNLGIGDAYVQLGHAAEAEAAYDAAYAVADDLRPASQLLEACERRAVACERRGDAAGAARARAQAASERALYDRERGHARMELERILKEM